ncbi:MAG TPA: LCP family protein [Clostridiales bacterium]|nr:LCP family protein [Clostridiales bacterium]
MRRLTCLLLSLIMLCSSALAITQREDVLNKISVLSPEQIPATPEGMHHYLLLCMDSWNAKLHNLSNSDGMVLFSVDEATGRLMITSFIRDMLVIYPDGKPGRLTHIVKKFGVQGLIDTINRHFGIQIDKYILMDWGQVQAIVDAAGGVKLNVTNAEASYLKNYAISSSSTTPSMTYGGDYYFTGHAAVIYMRMRKVRASNGETQDFGRTFRTRYVLSQLADSLRDISYEEAEKLLDAILSNTLDTNLTVTDALEAFNTIWNLRHSPLETNRLPYDGTVHPYEYYGGAGQLLDFEINRELLADFLFQQSFVVND